MPLLRVGCLADKNPKRKALRWQFCAAFAMGACALLVHRSCPGQSRIAALWLPGLFIAFVLSDSTFVCTVQSRIYTPA